MKKQVWLILFLCVVGAVANAQQWNFKLGGSIAEAKGDFSKAGYGMGVGLEVSLMRELSNPAYSIGLTTGYGLYTGKSVGNDVKEKMPTLGLIPIAASLQYTLLRPSFSFGVDVGYAFSMVNSQHNGGFYYQPKLGYKFSHFKNEIYLSYRGCSAQQTNIAAIHLGYVYTFGQSAFKN